MKMRKAELLLPADVWMMILGFLDFPDLLSMVSVSRYIYQLASHRSLMRNININKVKISRHGFSQLFSVTRSPKFDNIQQLDLSNFFQNTKEWSYFFHKVYTLKKFPDLKLTYVNLCDVPSRLLAKAISVLRKVDLYRTRLRSAQSRAILSSSLDSTSLQELNLGWVNMSRVPASVLGCAVARLRLANLEFTWLRPLQVRRIFREILKCSSLQELDLGDVSMRGVPHDLLARAVARLVRVNLRKTSLKSDQIKAILKVLPESSTLKELKLDRNKNPEFEDLASEALSALRKKNCDASVALANCDGLLQSHLLSLTHEPENVT